MPRTYVKKNPPKYSDASLELALQAVENGKSIYAAAKEYKIPYQTMRRWVVHKPKHKGPGRENWLTTNEESCIVQSLKFLAQCGHPFDRSDIANLIKTYFSYPNTRESPFKGKVPGPDYLRNFEKRWANEITKRKPEILTKARADNLTTETVNTFFETYTRIIQENNLQESPERIFNVDEAGMGTDSRNSAVFVSKSARNAYIKSANCGKTMYSVLFCVSASGSYMPPFTIYKGAHLYECWTKGGPSRAMYAVTESGWMQDSVFESWMDYFIIFTENLAKPVLLIYDGHGSHMTYGTIKKAIDNNIIILCLPPHTSHALQPLDVGVFSPLKKAWKNILKSWFRESRLQNVSKSVFPTLLNQLNDCLRPQNGVKGFEGSGLFPINRQAVEKRIIMSKITELVDQPSSSASTSYSLDSQSSEQVVHIAPEDHSSENTLLLSPLKDLKRAILTTLSPPISTQNKNAIQNSKAKRKRVQAKAGEVLTEEAVTLRLLKEQEERASKKLKAPKKEKTATSRSPPECTPPSTGPVSIGSWVLVNYAGKKNIKQFVGQVVDIVENLLSVKFLAKSKIGEFYTFPENEDTDEIEESAIVKILEEPNFDARGRYRFCI